MRNIPLCRLWLIVSVLCLVVSVPVMAQSGDETNKQSGPRTIAKQLLEKLEAALGKTLNGNQKKQILQSTKVLFQDVKALQQVFVQQISAITKLSQEDVAQLLPPLQTYRARKEKVILKIETMLGRKLTPEELSAMHKTVQEQMKSLQPLHKDYTEQVAFISTVPREKVVEILGAVGLAKTERGNFGKGMTLLQRFDKNKDDKLTKDEIPFLWSKLAAADLDQDGALTQEELQQFRQKHHTNKQPQPEPTPSPDEPTGEGESEQE